MQEPSKWVWTAMFFLTWSNYFGNLDICINLDINFVVKKGLLQSLGKATYFCNQDIHSSQEHIVHIWDYQKIQDHIPNTWNLEIFQTCTDIYQSCCNSLDEYHLLCLHHSICYMNNLKMGIWINLQTWIDEKWS